MSTDLSTRLRQRQKSLVYLKMDGTAALVADAADAIDALTARVAQLEACLTDTVQQLELGGVTE